ncbi:MAG: peptidoglycan DD-metalloendopeptidase family protein [Methylotenera sp.]
MKRLFLINLIVVLLASCAGTPPAPVVNRSPQTSTSTVDNANKQNNNTNSDWRPDSYVVKRGDTLYSIGLNHGYDYREIAEANNIAEPYTIRIGQRLSFVALNNKDSKADEKPTEYENEDGVIITPIDVGNAETSSVTKTTSSVVTPVLSSPKAIRESYSLEAYNRKAAVVPVTPPTAVTKLPTTTEPDATKDVTAPAPVAVSDTGWSWPTQGKVIASFNEATNKGVDIAGTKGQAINASAAGKVIYSGSDLRGYGKLVIIKHNPTFLSVYAHNSKILVKEGQSVKSGQKIAEMGDTDTNRIKLHFEIRERGKSVDPTKYLPQN